MIKIVKGPYNYFDLVLDDLQSKGFVIGFDVNSLNMYHYHVQIDYDSKMVDKVYKNLANPNLEVVTVKSLVKEAALSHRDLFAVFVGDSDATYNKLINMLTKREFKLISDQRNGMALINFENKTFKFIDLDDVDDLMESYNIAVLPIKAFKHVLKKLFVKETSESIGLKIDVLVNEVINKLEHINSFSRSINSTGITASSLSAIGQVKSISKKVTFLPHTEKYVLKDTVVFNQHNIS